MTAIKIREGDYNLSTDELVKIFPINCLILLNYACLNHSLCQTMPVFKEINKEDNAIIENCSISVVLQIYLSQNDSVTQR